MTLYMIYMHCTIHGLYALHYIIHAAVTLQSGFILQIVCPNLLSQLYG